MARLHLRKILILGSVFAAFCLVLIFKRLLHDPTYDYERDVPAVDPDLWKLLGPRTTVKKAQIKTTPVEPQVHLKQLPVPRFGDMNLNMTLKEMEKIFFRYLENKDIKCDSDMRLGSPHDGGWNVCMSPPFLLKQPCVVFSFGIGYDWQFDNTVVDLYNCTVLAYDPSMKQQDEVASSMIHFKVIGIGGENKITEDGWQLKTLAQHLKDEGLWGVPVDYVKIDVEYTEWQVLKTAFQDESLRYVKQLGFEMHTRRFLNTEDRSEGDEKLDFIHMYETLRQVEILGFKKFNYRKNPFGNYNSKHTGKERSCCYELHYINTAFLGENQTVIHTQDSRIFY